MLMLVLMHHAFLHVFFLVVKLTFSSVHNYFHRYDIHNVNRLDTIGSMGLVYLPTFTININHSCRQYMPFVPWIRHGDESSNIKIFKQNSVGDTLPETNIAPENKASEKESSLPTIHFQEPC